MSRTIFTAVLLVVLGMSLLVIVSVVPAETIEHFLSDLGISWSEKDSGQEDDENGTFDSETAVARLMWSLDSVLERPPFGRGGILRFHGDSNPKEVAFASLLRIAESCSEKLAALAEVKRDTSPDMLTIATAIVGVLSTLSGIALGWFNYRNALRELEFKLTEVRERATPMAPPTP